MKSKVFMSYHQSMSTKQKINPVGYLHFCFFSSKLRLSPSLTPDSCFEAQSDTGADDGTI